VIAITSETNALKPNYLIVIKEFLSAALDQPALGQQTSGYPYGLFFSVRGGARRRVKILFIFCPVQREREPDEYPPHLRDAP